jgi:hypothetical protein
MGGMNDALVFMYEKYIRHKNHQMVLIMKNTSVTTCMKLIIRSTALVALLACQNSNATVVGNLVTDDTDDTIFDSSLNREYTQFDAFDYTVAQTIAEIGVGGTYEGWSIADASVADDFNTAACAGTCGTITGWTDGLFGESLSTTQDYYGYIESGTADLISLVGIRDTGVVSDYGSWSTATALDSYFGDNSINLLLYRDVTAIFRDVTAPNILVLLGMGLLGVGAVTKRRTRKH